MNAEVEERKDTKCTDLPWVCERCNSLLGYVDKKTKTLIRIKSKDLYVWVKDPAGMGVACRGCGWLNELLDEDKLELKSSPGAAGARASR